MYQQYHHVVSRCFRNSFLEVTIKLTIVMQKLITIIFTFFTVLGFSQHVKMEVLEYPKYFSEVKYATYHFVQSSYSSSRPYTLIILSIAGMPGTVQGGDGKYYFLN